MTGCINLVSGASLSALLTPIIAVITVLILILQYLLAARTTRLALYEKRYPVFLETLRLIYLICRNGKAERIDLNLFRWSKEQHQFLFREDVPAFMELLYKNGIDLVTTATLLAAAKDQADLEKYAQRQKELLLWFGDQTTTARALFGRYLRIPRG